ARSRSHRAPVRKLRTSRTVVPTRSGQILARREILPQKPAQKAVTGRLTPRYGRLGRIFHRGFAPNPTRYSARHSDSSPGAPNVLTRIARQCENYVPVAPSYQPD